jgi:hypothetical protein
MVDSVDADYCDSQNAGCTVVGLTEMLNQEDHNTNLSKNTIIRRES